MLLSASEAERAPGLADRRVSGRRGQPGHHLGRGDREGGVALGREGPAAHPEAVAEFIQVHHLVGAAGPIGQLHQGAGLEGHGRNGGIHRWRPIKHPFALLVSINTQGLTGVWSSSWVVIPSDRACCSLGQRG